MSVGPDGPVAIWSRLEGRERFVARSEGPAEARFPEPPTAASSPVALTRYTGSSTAADQVVEVPALPVPHPLVQPLPGGSFLVAGARCEWHPDGPERNALIFDERGEEVARGTLGDGIEHLLADGEGAIWAGYFDEGVYGNLGWGDVGAPEPLGSAGIVRWNAAFEKVWEHDQSGRSRIDDCYALNVGHGRSWACTYSNFPLLELTGDRVEVRSIEGVQGPRGVIVADRRVGLIGDYDYGGVLLLGSLDGTSKVKKRELGLPDGRLVPPGVLVCRGSVADLFVGAEWFRFDLAEVD